MEICCGGGEQSNLPGKSLMSFPREILANLPGKSLKRYSELSVNSPLKLMRLSEQSVNLPLKLMRLSKHSVCFFPEEIVEEILANLPVKSLMRFKCVSKSWRYLIGTKTFIKKHLQNSKRRGIAIVNEFCSIVDDDMLLVRNPISDDPLKGGWIIGCCNGLQCIRNNGHFFLSNPATRIFVTLPVFDYVAEAVADYGWREVRCAFGWDEESDAYKVLVMTNDGRGLSLGKVYSSKTNSWKKIDCGKVGYLGAPDHIEVGVLVSGKIHWVPDSECCDEFNYFDCVEYFDLKTEVFGRMKLPSEPEGGLGRWWLRERDGYLHALYSHTDYDREPIRSRRKFRRAVTRLKELHGPEYMDDLLEKIPLVEEVEEEEELFDVWVMEEYGVEESWVKKKTNIPILKSTLEYQEYVYVESLISPACHQHRCASN